MRIGDRLCVRRRVAVFHAVFDVESFSSVSIHRCSPLNGNQRYDVSYK